MTVNKPMNSFQVPIVGGNQTETETSGLLLHTIMMGAGKDKICNVIVLREGDDREALEVLGAGRDQHQ